MLAQEAAAAQAQAASSAPLIPLLPETGEDRRRASLVKFKRKIPDGELPLFGNTAASDRQH